MTIFVWAHLGTSPFFCTNQVIIINQDRRRPAWATSPSPGFICPPQPQPHPHSIWKGPSAQPRALACTVPSVSPSPARPFFLSFLSACWDQALLQVRGIQWWSDMKLSAFAQLTAQRGRQTTHELTYVTADKCHEDK